MKPVIIIGSRNFGKKNDPAQIFEAIETDQKQLIYWEDLVFDITSTSQAIYDSVSGLNIADASLVLLFNWYKKDGAGIYKDAAFALALYLESKSVKFWNQEALLQRSSTKLSAMMQLSLAGITIPGTLFSMNKQAVLAKQQQFPCIAKACSASRGNDNHLVTDSLMLESIIPADTISTYLIQEFIPNDYDLRIICFGGKPSMAIKRQRTNAETHLNNTSQGAQASQIELHEIPAQVLTNTEKISKIMQRQMAGVDWLIANDGSGQYACLEVNAIPQLTTGTYVPEKLKKLNEMIQSEIRVSQ
jgi:glutathione synthase/RimK-type ligase-like ATP-grasp enzyme